MSANAISASAALAEAFPERRNEASEPAFRSAASTVVVSPPSSTAYHTVPASFSFARSVAVVALTSASLG